ncbi:MAG: hypothetical protein ACR2RL_15505 [Gammaproteobacteria bacterium]
MSLGLEGDNDKWNDWSERKSLAEHDLPEADTARLTRAATQSIIRSMKPAYEKLTHYMSSLEQQASNDDGAWKFPDGKRSMRRLCAPRPLPISRRRPSTTSA